MTTGPPRFDATAVRTVFSGRGLAASVEDARAWPVSLSVVVQSDLLSLSAWLVAPTSTSARAATFRPEVSIGGRPTRVLAEQTSAVNPQRLGESAGHLSSDELRQVDAALRLVLNL